MLNSTLTDDFQLPLKDTPAVPTSSIIITMLTT